MRGKLRLNTKEEVVTPVTVPVEEKEEFVKFDVMGDGEVVKVMKKRAPRKKKVKETTIKVVEVPLERVDDVLHMTIGDILYKVPYPQLHIIEVLFEDKYDYGIELHWDGRLVCENKGFVSSYIIDKMLALTQFL